MARFWCSFAIENNSAIVVIVDAPDRAQALERARAVGSFGSSDPLVLELPPSEARRFDGWLGRVLGPVELAVLDPGSGLLEVTNEQILEAEMLAREDAAKERAPS